MHILAPEPLKVKIKDISSDGNRLFFDKIVSKDMLLDDYRYSFWPVNML